MLLASCFFALVLCLWRFWRPSWHIIECISSWTLLGCLSWLRPSKPWRKFLSIHLEYMHALSEGILLIAFRISSFVNNSSILARFEARISSACQFSFCPLGSGISIIPLKCSWIICSFSSCVTAHPFSLRKCRMFFLLSPTCICVIRDASIFLALSNEASPSNRR